MLKYLGTLVAYSHTSKSRHGLMMIATDMATVFMS